MSRSFSSACTCSCSAVACFCKHGHVEALDKMHLCGLFLQRHEPGVRPRPGPSASGDAPVDARWHWHGAWVVP